MQSPTCPECGRPMEYQSRRIEVTVPESRPISDGQLADFIATELGLVSSENVQDTLTYKCRFCGAFAHYQRV